MIERFKKNKMDNIKILVISHMYPNNALPNSGIFIHEQIKHLIKAGCLVKVVSPVPYAPKVLTFNPKWGKYNKIHQQKEIDGVHVIYPRYICFPGLWFHNLSCYTMYLGILTIIKSIMRKFQPDIIHAHTITDGYVCLLLKQNYKIPIICSLRGSDIHTYPYQSKLTMLLTKKVLSNADQIISVSHALKTTAETIKSPRRPIKVVYNGCDLTHFSFSEEDRIRLRKDRGICKNEVVIMFIGFIAKDKGIFELINAFIKLKKKYSSIHLIILGDGPERNNIKYIIRSNGMSNIVHLLGIRPHHEISKWLSASDIFTLPTYNEGLPNVVLEAMACALPVIATRVGGIPEIVKDSHNGILVKEKDSKALYDALESLLRNVELAKKMGENSREIAENNLSWLKSAAKTIDIYKDVINMKVEDQ